MEDTYCKYYKQVEYDKIPHCILEECQLNICPMVYRCQERHTWRPLKGMVTCSLIDEHERNLMMKNGDNIVRFVKDGLLYVELYDNDGNATMVVTIKNPYDYEPKSVKVVEVNHEYYVEGFEPKAKVELDDVKVEVPKKIIKKNRYKKD